MAATDEVAKTERSLWVEGCISEGANQGMGLILFLVSFGSRDALSSTLALLVDKLDVQQSIVIIGATGLLTWWAYCNLMDKWIIHHLINRLERNDSWIKRISIMIGFISMILVSGPWIAICLVLIGILVQHMVAYHRVPDEAPLIMICLIVPIMTFL